MGPGALVAHQYVHIYCVTSRISNLASSSLDELTHSAAYTWENLSDPKTGHSYRSDQCPMSTHLGREINCWDYFCEPGQEFRRHRFDLAMKGMQSLQPAAAVLDGAFYNCLELRLVDFLITWRALGLEWGKLPKGSTVVDVGGGIGTYMAPLAENFPELKIVVQDLPKTIQNAHEVRSNHYAR